MLTAHIYEYKTVRQKKYGGSKAAANSIYLKLSENLKEETYTVRYEGDNIILRTPDIDDREAPKRIHANRILLPYRAGMEGNYEGEQINSDLIIFTKL